MAVNPNEDTEFNDALRKHGILPPKEPEPRTPSPPPAPTLAELNDDDLDDLLEDGADSDTERYIASLQRTRAAEHRKEVREARFGRVYPIAREDYMREVTEASRAPDPSSDPDVEGVKGTGVVIMLYKPAHLPSTTLAAHLDTLAARYPNTKFTSIVGDKCIPNYPDQNVPTLICYRDGQVVDQLVAWGAGVEKGTLEHLEIVLLGLRIIIPSKHTARAQANASNNRESDGEDDLPRHRAEKGIRQSKTGNDSDSDFDL